MFASRERVRSEAGDTPIAVRELDARRSAVHGPPPKAGLIVQTWLLLGVPAGNLIQHSCDGDFAEFWPAGDERYDPW